MASSDINELYQQFKDGQKQVEAALFEALSARFYLFVRQRIRNKEDAEEIVQKALLAINSELSGLEVQVSFAAWAYKVLDNRIKAYLKTVSRSKITTDLETESDRYEAMSTERFDPELKRLLLLCLEKLGKVNRRYARTLNLKTQGFTTEEICTKLEITASNFYSLLFRARAMLAGCLHDGEVR
ncbi:MAG: RNA polymerase sigma factor [candidate division Zixibacteria bacterium]